MEPVKRDCPTRPEIKKWVVVEIVVSIVSFIVVGIVAVIANFAVPPYYRGFFCDDQRISYPYTYDSTVTSTTLYLVSLLGPIAVIVFTEIANAFFSKQWQKLAKNIVYAALRMVFGYALTIMVTMIVKKMTGRLRPDFLSVCQPDYSTIDCTRFVQNVTCGQTDMELIDYARTSFPSGHTSFAVYSAVFVGMYLSLRASWPIMEYPAPFLQSIGYLLATYSAISRVIDNKHHWEDLVGGAIIGILIGLAMFRNYLPDLLRGESDPRTTEMTTNGRKLRNATPVTRDVVTVNNFTEAENLPANTSFM